MNDLHLLLEEAVAFHKASDLSKAEPIYLSVLEIQPCNARALNNLANIYSITGKYNESFDLLQRALLLNPNSHITLNLLANLKLILGEARSAHEYITKAIKESPEVGDSYLTLSNILWMLDRPDDSLSAVLKAIELKPKLTNAYITLGVIYQFKGELCKAISATKHVLSSDSTNPQALANLSCMYFLSSDYLSGWSTLERWEIITKTNKPKSMQEDQRWRGEILGSSQELLIVTGEGLGDTIQFMRYALLLKSLDIKYTLCAQSTLLPLIRHSLIDNNPISLEDKHIEPRSKWITLRSLPGKLGVTSDNAIVERPYIQAPPKLVEKWSAILYPYSKPLIAINWQGSRKNEMNCLKGRSFPLELFSEIASLGKYSLISIQKGYGSEQLDSCSFKESFLPVQSKIDPVWDFLEISAILSKCSLVITTDTVTAHLSAALGRPTWILLQKVPDWRWGLTGDRSFWYPSVRLFRQKHSGQWSDVLIEIRKALEDYSFSPS